MQRRATTLLRFDIAYLTSLSVFLLVSLRHTLLRLSIGANLRIDDDAIPALMMFKKLCQLKIKGTQIAMDGLRRYATNIDNQGRTIHVEIPVHCQCYLSCKPTSS